MKTFKLGRIQSESGQTYFLLLEYDSVASSDVCMSILLTDVTRAWSRDLNSEFFTGQAQRTRLSVDNYLFTTVTCLTGVEQQEGCGSKYVVQVKALKDSDDLELTWKRQLVDDDICFKLGSATLQAADVTDSLRTILSFGVNRIKELEMLDATYRKTEELFVQERKAMLDKLDTYVSAKEDMERHLYSTFATVLNEKKAKIQRLMSTRVPAPDRGGGGTTEPRPCPAVATKRTKRDEAVGEESDPDNVPSDVEEDDGQETPVIRRKKSKAVHLAVADDLFPDSSEEQPMEIPLTRRLRTRAALEKSKPSSSTGKVKASKPPAAASTIRKSHRQTAVQEKPFDSDELFADM